jgi:hypothetical protein
MASGGKSQSEELWWTATSLRWLARDIRREPIQAKLLAIAIDCERQAAALERNRPVQVATERSRSRLRLLAPPTPPPAPLR